MLTQVIRCCGPTAVTTADLSYHVLAAMGTPALNLHLKQVAVCRLTTGLDIYCSEKNKQTADLCC